MAILGKGMSERDDMPGEPDHGRRRFLGRAAMTLAAVRFGISAAFPPKVGESAEALAEAGIRGE